MPLGFQRLNERTQRPNANINFIKPLESPDKEVAQDFLERIAAQCHPIMKEHYLSVMSLEEYPPNPEFLGRNFNAGEVIQLVLKDRSGRWLSFKFVQMVMMHELAHCKQMNHSRFFWGVRNGYAKQMEELWTKRYTGEGMWGRGKNLATGAFVHETMPENAQIPEHLCGGTYRRARGRKRKRGRGQETAGKEKLSYAERQQRRIARKFGKHGEGSALGDDELVRAALETKSGGKRQAGKPRVANSKRGRELRANAALARFESSAKQKVKQESPEGTPELEDDGGSETDSDYWSSDGDIDSPAAAEARKHNNNIKDRDGKDLVKVCGDEGEDDASRNAEMDELRMLSGRPQDIKVKEEPVDSAGVTWPTGGDESETESEPDGETAKRKQKRNRIAGNQSPDDINADEARGLRNEGREAKSTAASSKSSSGTLPTDVLESSAVTSDSASEPPSTTNMPTSKVLSCPICSLENEPDNPTCIACAHVLKPGLIKNTWRCTSDTCKGTEYVNAGDVGRCGVCGASKPPPPPPAAATTTSSRNQGKAVGMGFMDADTLRWD
ncbi:WLM domain-containing protein [Hortaea werneckii]|uniref:WLM domain-containing protein n=1 Tax=Hortaea werneckii TaxID=91943 RepID=A0A3M7F6W8_HORWE|nr:WLM domain-containing protein [Hortaea werneckii]KAI6881364.1 WLM domain-containing protein [Hortaea werneckii]KAI6990675.1 WLM domain-containing protein [Hortaea werneckii]KAI7143734.1 WLM domain-containing protein [Hortaea werneckii]KAI7171564.1 WLM domain-containing protein [Hortaea werneckii]